MITGRAINKTLVGIVLVCMVSVGFSHAQEGGATDCSTLGNVRPDLYASKVEKTLQDDGYDISIYTNNDLGIAVTHLKQYCCAAGLVKEDSCEGVEVGKPYYPQSPFIYDHLMYVGMKKLDGDEEHCNILGIECAPKNYSVDPVEWRDQINEIAESPKGYPPGQIFELFKKYRGDNDNAADETIHTLKKAYNEMCTDAKKIRFVIPTPDLVDAWKHSSKNLDISCANITTERYQKEARYVRTLQIEKGTKYFVDNLKSYLNDYFINKRMADLVGKYAELDGCFTAISRYTQKTAECN